MKNNWVLLSEARTALLWRWDIATGVLLFFLLIQQTTGVIEGANAVVWGWFFICLLPGLLSLHLSAWLRRHTDKVLSHTAYRALSWLTIGYVMLVLVVFFFSRAAIDNNEYGLITYYVQSLWVIMPFNLLLLVGFWVLFFTKEMPFKPSPAIIQQIAGEKAISAAQKNLQVQLICYESLREGQLEKAFNQTNQWLEGHNADNYTLGILLQGRYHQVKREIELNTLSQSEAQIEINRISISLIDLISDIQA
jgi:Effector-associated domain 11